MTQSYGLDANRVFVQHQSRGKTTPRQSRTGRLSAVSLHTEAIELHTSCTSGQMDPFVVPPASRHSSAHLFSVSRRRRCGSSLMPRGVAAQTRGGDVACGVLPAVALGKKMLSGTSKRLGCA